MSDEALAARAQAAGVATSWKDVFGVEHAVGADTLRTVLSALGVDIPDQTPPLVTATQGEPTHLPGLAGAFQLHTGHGVFDGHIDDDEMLPAIAEPGYHTLESGGRQITIAVAPPRCFGIADTGASRPWGLAVQLYSLRRPNDGGIGDFEALRQFVRAAAGHGADAVAISPVHAQFSADLDRFSPYAPSSRVMLNVLHAQSDGDAPSEGLIDWPAASRARLAAFRSRFAADAHDPGFAAFRAERGPLLESHARFEMLHAALFTENTAQWHWRNWPEKLRDPNSRHVAAIAEENATEVAFHAWLQYRADRDLAAAQRAARGAGMKIGLITDLAVGTDDGGSQSWSRQGEMLPGMTIGAPPDLLSPHGQNWGLVAFSPSGLRHHGYAAFIDMLRAAFRHAGGIRIDHVMGLARLWVVPQGASAADGTYLSLPARDLLRLTALESWRHGAVVLGEDLGTLPEGFQPLLEGSGVLGMRVLWFERAGQLFTRPSTWSRGAVAMTSTHDLPTVAGWWQGRDLGWRAGLGLLRDEAADRAERATDRGVLWDAMLDSGAATGPCPVPEDVTRATDAAVAHVAGAACDLMLLPMEDALAEPEQPNLPGTLDEHPNWRRRMTATVNTVLDTPAVAARLAAVARARA